MGGAGAVQVCQEAVAHSPLSPPTCVPRSPFPLLPSVCALTQPQLPPGKTLPAPDMLLLLLGLTLPTTIPSPALFRAGALPPELTPKLTSPIPLQPQAPLPTLYPAPPAP